MGEFFSVRIPRDLREKMRRYKHINWSEVVRRAILEKIAEEERRDKRLKAAEVMDKIREDILKTYGPTDYDSSEVIRYWRDTRK